MGYSTAQLQAIAQQDAAAYGVPWDIFNGVITAESNWNPNDYNVSSGATGIAQILPSTAANPGDNLPHPNPNDPISSLDFAAAYLAALYKRAGTWLGAVQRYRFGYTPNDTRIPYAGNSTVQPYLQNAIDHADATGATPVSGATPASGASGVTVPGATDNSAGVATSGTGCWICDLVSKAGFILLGVIVIGLGIWMLAGSKDITVNGVSAT